jgi:Glutathionylspermidine synthase preATP-grasp
MYGRFDFSFKDGVPKLLEFNADTPTTLVEASVAQWFWFQDLFGDEANVDKVCFISFLSFVSFSLLFSLFVSISVSLFLMVNIVRSIQFHTSKPIASMEEPCKYLLYHFSISIPTTQVLSCVCEQARRGFPHNKLFA